MTHRTQPPDFFTTTPWSKIFGFQILILCGMPLLSNLWKDMGFSRSEALDALLPLVISTISNLGDPHTQNMATGPITRGDLGTVTSHLEILQSHKEEVLPLYVQLGASMTQLAQEQGYITNEIATTFKELFEKYTDGKLMTKGSKFSAEE